MKKEEKPKLLGEGLSVVRLDDSQLAAQMAAAKARCRALGLPAFIIECNEFGMSRECTWRVVKNYFGVSFREFKNAWDSKARG